MCYCFDTDTEHAACWPRVAPLTQQKRVDTSVSHGRTKVKDKVPPCSLVVHQHLGELLPPSSGLKTKPSLHCIFLAGHLLSSLLHPENEDSYVPPKRQWIYTGLHGVTSQNIHIRKYRKEYKSRVCTSISQRILSISYPNALSCTYALLIWIRMNRQVAGLTMIRYAEVKLSW
jgi:hypothetical protein